MNIRQFALPVVFFAATMSAEAALIDRDGGFIYDDVQDITWQAQPRNTETTQYIQRAWASGLVVVDSLRYTQWDDWRLPTMAEYSHLYYTDGVTSATPSPFVGVSNRYWSGDDCYGGNNICAYFNFDDGSSGLITDVATRFAWAVRDGDVRPPPAFLAQFVYTTTISASPAPAIPGVAAGDTLTITVIADNGGNSLASQDWLLADIVSVTATVGTYRATYRPPHYLIGDIEPAFSTDANGDLTIANYGNISSVSNTDVFSPTTADPDIKLYGNGLRDSQGRYAYYPNRYIGGPSGWALARAFLSRVAWRNASAGDNVPGNIVDNLDSGTEDRGTYTVTGAGYFFPDTDNTTTVDGSPYARFLLQPGEAGTLTFNEPIYALGFEVNPWCNLNVCSQANSLGAPVSVAIDGVPVTTYNLPATDVTEFRGFISSVPFTTFTITTNAPNAWHGIDNVEAYSVPPDTDSDGVSDSADNCTLVANPEQCDSDGDGYGNRCDGDLNNNTFTNSQDYILFRAQLGQPSVAPTRNQADLNCNGFVNAQDYVLFRSLLGAPPGPSALVDLE